MEATSCGALGHSPHMMATSWMSGWSLAVAPLSDVVRAIEAAVAVQAPGIDHKLNLSPWKMTVLCNC